MRIVSLVPSSTETLLALGADVVACTRFCEQPQLRHVGGTKNPDLDAIVDLAPDLVVLDREENRREDHDALVAAGVDVFVSEVRTLDDAIWVVGGLADAIGLRATGLREPEPPATGPRRRAFVPIWRRPWMTISASTYGGSLLAHLGIDVVTPVAADDADDPTSSDYPVVELGDVAGCRPDLVLVPSEPYEFGDDHVDAMREAVPTADVRRIDGRDLFWWGIRTAPAVGRLAAELAPRPEA